MCVTMFLDYELMAKFDHQSLNTVLLLFKNTNFLNLYA